MSKTTTATLWLRNTTGYSKRYMTRADLTKKTAVLDCSALVTDEHGNVVSSAVTATDKDTYALLWDYCPIFKMDIQSGALVKCETQPKDAVSDGQKISDLTDEVTSLRTQLATALSASPANDLQKQIDALKAENEALKAQQTGADK